MKKIIGATALFAALMFVGTAALAQAAQPAPAAPQLPTNAFSISASAVPLFGQGQTQPATIVGEKLQFTQNVVLREDNLIAPGASLGGYFGGLDYKLPASLFKKTLFANQFFPYVSGSAGIVRLTASGSPTQNRFGALLGGGLNYCPAGNGTVCLNLVEARWARLPGFANSTVLLSSGLSVNWNW